MADALPRAALTTDSSISGKLCAMSLTRAPKLPHSVPLDAATVSAADPAPNSTLSVADRPRTEASPGRLCCCGKDVVRHFEHESSKRSQLGPALETAEALQMLQICSARGLLPA